MCMRSLPHKVVVVSGGATVDPTRTVHLWKVRPTSWSVLSSRRVVVVSGGASQVRAGGLCWVSRCLCEGTQAGPMQAAGGLVQAAVCFQTVQNCLMHISSGQITMLADGSMILQHRVPPHSERLAQQKNCSLHIILMPRIWQSGLVNPVDHSLTQC